MQEEDKIVKRPSTFPVFSKNLALQPTTAVEFANDCRKHFEQFNEGFKRRIAIQLQYAKNLEALSKSLDKYIQPGTEKAISFICSAFKVENQQRAHQARQLAQSLRTQIYQICLNTSREQANVIKRIEKDVKKYIKEFEYLEDSLNRSKENYEKVSEDMEELMITKNYVKYTSEIAQQKKAKMVGRTMQSIKQKKQYQKLYMSANRNYNQFVREYNKCITQDLNTLQRQIRDQIILQSDSLRKLIVCEVSMFKNIQYDLINISKQMQVMDMQRDVELVVENSMGKEENLIVQVEEYKRMIANSVKEKRKSAIASSDISSVISVQQQVIKTLQPKQSQIDRGMTAIVLKQVEQQVFNRNLSHKRSKQFKELIQKRWCELNGKIEVKGQNSVITQNQQALNTTNIHNHTQQTKDNHSSQSSSQPNVPDNQPQSSSPSQPQPLIRQLFDTYINISTVIKQLLQSKSPQEKSQTINQLYDNFIIITQFISELWNGLPITLIQTKKKKPQTQSSTLNHIKKLLSVNHFYRILSYAFLQSFRTHHQVMIYNQDRARELAKFIIALLTKSHKENDVFVLRGLLGLLFTYFWMDTSKRLLYSQSSIYKHSLWKKHDFWDSAIFQSTFQEMLSFGPQKGQSFQETILRQKNLIFTQLASYCHYMIMLGISSKNVRQIVGRYCRLYEMTDDQNRDLSKMITNTVKQFKEIFASKAQKETQ